MARVCLQDHIERGRFFILDIEQWARGIGGDGRGRRGETAHAPA